MMMMMMKERFCDDFKEECTIVLNSSETFSPFVSFKSNLLTENYFEFVKINILEMLL